MPEEVHERVDAHVNVSEFGGEGVAQTMNQCAAGPFAVDATGPVSGFTVCSAVQPCNTAQEVILHTSTSSPNKRRSRCSARLIAGFRRRSSPLSHALLRRGSR